MTDIGDERPFKFKVECKPLEGFRRYLEAIRYVLHERWKDYAPLIANDGKPLNSPTLASNKPGIHEIRLTKARDYNTPEIVVCTVIRVQGGEQWYSLRTFEAESLVFEVEITFVGTAWAESTKQLHSDVLHTMANVFPSNYNVGLRERLEAEAMRFKPPADMPQPRVTRGPNLATTRKIDDLKEMLANSRRNHQKPMGWIKACQHVDIDPDTAKTHAPELRGEWDSENSENSEIRSNSDEMLL